MPPKIIGSPQAETLYLAYPKHVARADALKAIQRALLKAPYEVLLEAVQAYAAARRGQDAGYTPYPASWFNDERWEDDRSHWSNGKSVTRSRASEFYDVLCCEVRRIGAREVPSYPDQASRDAVRAMGGWGTFCSWDSTQVERRRKSFLQHYREQPEPPQ